MAELRLRIRHDLLSVEQATKMVGLTRPSIMKRILEGEIGAEKVGQYFFCERADIERLARERLKGPGDNAANA